MSDNFTIEVWFKLSSIGSNWEDYNGSPRILCKVGPAGPSFSNYSVHIEHKSDSDKYSLVCGYYNGRDWVSVKMCDSPGEPTIKTDTWYGLIYQSNIVDGSMSMFVFNESAAGGGRNPAWDISGLLFWERIAVTGKPRVSNELLIIGSGGRNSQNTWFDGYVDNIVIYQGIKAYAIMDKIEIPQMPLQSLELSARHIDRNTIHLSWRENNTNDGYRIYRSNRAKFEAKEEFLIGTGTEPSYTDSTADERQVYYYQIGIIDQEKNEYY
ncbi:MAG: hypothetical protein GY839_07790, partial [candidate division Zixibacteria bacterium]|nr:hypothetical protein [candidate division Zixibacteria bacterium]